jgi:hypothetical protein
LIINYSAEITYEKNLEKFLNQQSDSSISDMMENFDGAGSSLLKRLSAFSEEEEAINQNQGDQSIKLPASQIQAEEENRVSVPAPQVFLQEEEARPTVYQPQPQEEEARSTVYQPQPQEEEARPTVYQPQPQEEEARSTVYQPQPQEEEARPTVYQPQPQEEENKYYNIIGEKNPKEEQATKKESKRPNINKYLENKKHQMTNKLVRSINPININVSYNNPVALNGFNNPDTNMNRYRFDSGLNNDIRYPHSNRKRDCKNCFDNNDSIRDSVNSTYYPAYLDNPLNKNVGGTEIPAVRQQSNYEQDRQKQILTEKNNPAPVMLGNEWAEWAPV